MKTNLLQHLGADPLHDAHVLEKSEINNLEVDLRIIRVIREVLASCLQEMDDSRLLVVLSVCKTSKAKLRLMLPRLLGQIERAGLSADILLGLNQDPELTDLFTVLRRKVSTIEHVYSRVVGGGAGEQAQAFVDSEPQSGKYAIGDPASSGHRMIVVHQEPDSRTRGKNLMLRELNDMTLSAVTSGSWMRVPSRMLECDDDSILFVEGDPSANPIEILIQEMRERHLSAIGAHYRSAKYSLRVGGKELYEFPDTSVPLDPMYRWMDTALKEWVRCLVGGGTLGDTSLLTAVRWPICHRYPGSLSEDLHKTMYIDQLGQPWDVSRRVGAFNQVRGDDQILRSLRSNTALKAAFGSGPLSKLSRSLEMPRELREMDMGRLPGLFVRSIADSPASLQGSANW